MKDVYDSRSGKLVFYLTLPFFLFLELYGVFHSEQRLCFEAASQMIYIPVWRFSSPFYRYSFVLNKFLLQPAFDLHLPLKMIGIIFCVNDLIFYLLVAILIIVFTRQYLYAAVVLAAPVLLHGLTYYFMVNELFLSGSMMILYVAVYRFMPDRFFKKALLGVSVFYAIWGHPFSICLVLLFLLSLYTTIDQMKKDKMILLFISINIIARLIGMTGYDSGETSLHVRDMMQTYTSCGALMSGLLDSMAGYTSHYWIIPVLLLITIVSTRPAGRNIWLAVTSLLVFYILKCLFFPHRYWSDSDVSKLMYSPHLFIFLYCIVTIFERFAFRSGAALLILITAMFVNLRAILFSDYNRIVRQHIALIREINAICEKRSPACSKYYIRLARLPWKDEAGNANFFSESLFFSAMDYHDHATHIIYATDSTIGILDRVPEDAICMSGGLDIKISQLGPLYHPIMSGPYQEWVPDADMIDQIRRIKAQP